MLNMKTVCARFNNCISSKQADRNKSGFLSVEETMAALHIVNRSLTNIESRYVTTVRTKCNFYVYMILKKTNKDSTIVFIL